MSTKGQNKHYNTRRRRKTLNNVNNDIPNMSGKKIAAVRYGDGITRRNFGRLHPETLIGSDKPITIYW